MNLPLRMFLALAVGLGGGMYMASQHVSGIALVLSVARPVGTLWLDALTMTIVPLVFGLIVNGLSVAAREATVLSTGTWFVAMRSPSSRVDLAALPERRDCLVNVDADGHPVPSARFMGGREIATLTGVDSRRIDIAPDQPELVAALPQALGAGARVLPTFAAGTGPFPHARGRWIQMPAEEAPRRAAVGLYAALMADVSLDLIGSRERILIEGRFAAAEVFVRALATLRRDTTVFVANVQNDVSYGALRLLEPTLKPPSSLQRVLPLDVQLDDCRAEWRTEAERMETAE